MRPVVEVAITDGTRGSHTWCSFRALLELLVGLLVSQKQQAEMEKELEALQKSAAGGGDSGTPKVEICPPSPKSGDAK